MAKHRAGNGKEALASTRALPESEAPLHVAPIYKVQAGRGALYLEVGADPSPELSKFLGEWQRALHEHRMHGVHEVIPAYRSLLIEYAPKLQPEAVASWALEWAPVRARGAETVGDAGGATAARAKTHLLDVEYGRNADRTDLEARLGLSFAEIVERHADTEFTVAFLGFTAGFPYLLGLPAELHTPRRARPRDVTPAGAVAIAGAQGGIYPTESPGGWWVLGITDAVLFDSTREPPPLVHAGDTVRFRPVRSGRSELGDAPRPNHAARSSGQTPAAGPSPAAFVANPEGKRIEVLEAWPRCVSLQATPRRGVGHWGMAEAGALDPRAFREANAIVGNVRDAVALEAIGQPVRLRPHESLRAAITGGGLSARLDEKPVARWTAFAWTSQRVLELVPDSQATGFTTYLAVAGGFDAHMFHGSPSTDARAGVGGALGYIRSGDILAARPSASPGVAQPYVGTPRYGGRVTLRVHPGPQFEPEAWRLLVQSSFRIDVLDRTGARLRGPAVSLSKHETVSEGSPAGAIQVPPNGQPIILLADRGRTGGYAKPAVVHPDDLWLLAQARPDTEIWFEGAAEPEVATEPVHWEP